MMTTVKWKYSCVGQNSKGQDEIIQEDIRTIVDKNPQLDTKRIQQWIQSFGEIYEIPNLWKDIAELVNQSK